MRKHTIGQLICLLTVVFFPALNGAELMNAELPPALEWHGASEAMLEHIDAHWKTPIEQSDFITTPSYRDTMAFLHRLAAKSSLIKLHTIGYSGEGRPIVVVVASHHANNSLSQFAHDKASRVLIQAGIHAGEIDGKDAGMMLLRDFALGKHMDLLQNSNFFFVPVFNVDGHEHFGPNQRINQRGPDHMGWRTTASNMNLNRDYMKADTPEMQAMLKLFQQLDPDIYLDIHVTDGIDYQYDITYGFNDTEPHSPAIAKLLTQTFRPQVDRALQQAGHIPGPLIFANDSRDLSKGLSAFDADPRFSHGYGDLRHMPAILVENHSLKPYKQRVLGTYTLYTETLRWAGEQNTSLRQAIALDRLSPVSSLHFNEIPTESNPVMTTFLGVESELYDSAISGAKEIRWLGKPSSLSIPVYTGHSTLTIQVPKAYWIPAQWRSVIAVLDRHGIRYEIQNQERTLHVQMYRLPDAKIHNSAFEARVGADSGIPKEEVMSRHFAAGSVRVPIDQPLGQLAVCLLEPQCSDSLFSWGYFHSILQATEYVEGYVVEPMAQQMMQDPAIKAEFAQALQNSAFAHDAEARLDWFYRKSGYADSEYRLYPIAREL